MKRNYETPFFRSISIGEIPLESLGIHANLFVNKLKVVQHRDRKQFAVVAYYGLMNERMNKIQK